MPNIASKSVENIRRAALSAVEQSKPAGIYFGTVTSISPLQVNIEQKLTLEAPQLILSSLVQNFTVEMTVDHMTEEAGGDEESTLVPHKHNYVGTKQFQVLLGLKKGEKVMLMRMQGGQKYVIMDRVR